MPSFIQPQRPDWRMPAPLSLAPSALLQRQCACGGTPGPTGECAECRKKRQGLLQRRAHGPEPEEAPPIVHEVLRSPGQPLDAPTRGLMEPRFGHDFGRVRIHAGPRAAESVRSVGAEAYTVGRHIVLGRGRDVFSHMANRRLLAHELAHTVQQRMAEPTAEGLRVAPRDDSLETEAEVAERSTEPDGGTPPVARASTQLARQPESGQTRTPASGVPSSDCGAYAANAWWLPLAYVRNAGCACRETPNRPEYNCIRKVLQTRLAATPSWLKATAAGQKPNELLNPSGYAAFVQTFLTPRIYSDHVVAYRSCCCSSGPAAYPAWVGVTTVPSPACSLVGLSIRWFGSCHGTPGSW